MNQTTVAAPCDKCGWSVMAGGCPHEDAACPQFPEDAKQLQNRLAMRTTEADLLCACGKEPVDCTYSLDCKVKLSDDMRRMFARAERQRRKRLGEQEALHDG